MEMFVKVFDVMATLLDGAKIRQVDRCMTVLVKEGYVKKDTPEYYKLKDQLR